jgi:hypothetical protein
MGRNTTLLTTAVATLLAAAAAPGQEVVTRDLGEGANPESSVCNYSFTASNIKWCLNANGNLVSLQSPGTVEHIRVGAAPGYAVEGYVLCVSGDLRAYDLAVGSRGFGPPTVIAAQTTTGITIRRKTLDGTFQLDQKWSRDNTERDLTVQMTLKNLGPAVSEAILIRVADVNVDFNLDGKYPDHFDRTKYSLWFRDPVNGRDGVTMKVLTLNQINGVFVQPFTHAVSCATPAELPLPSVAPVDVMGKIGYAFASITGGSQKVVKVGYRVE